MINNFFYFIEFVWDIFLIAIVGSFIVLGFASLILMLPMLLCIFMKIDNENKIITQQREEQCIEYGVDTGRLTDYNTRQGCIVYINGEKFIKKLPTNRKNKDE